MKTKEGREIKFWSCDPHAEYLHHETREAAIRDWLEGQAGHTPETFTVSGFAQMEPLWPDGERLLEMVFENIDDECGDPDGSWADHLTPEMEQAAQLLSEIIKRDYKVWACEVVHQEEVKTADVMP